MSYLPERFLRFSASFALVPNMPDAAALLKPLSKKAEIEGESSSVFFIFFLAMRYILYKLIRYSILVILCSFASFYNPEPLIWYASKRLTNQPICPDPFGICDNHKPQSKEITNDHFSRGSN